MYDSLNNNVLNIYQKLNRSGSGDNPVGGICGDIDVSQKYEMYLIA
jgi:hypothetical protein